MASRRRGDVPRRTPRQLPAMVCGAALLAVSLIGCSDEPPTAASSGDAPPSTGVVAGVSSTTTTASPVEGTLRGAADAAGVLIGTAVRPELLASDSDYAATIAREFNSVTAENVMKWEFVQPEQGTWTFEDADAVVAFAREHDLAVKGHTLVWAQGAVDATPDWVEEITDPDELRAVLDEHITTVLEHFGDDVDRWDVVNEPLEVTGTALFDNHFHQVLGPDYIAYAFEAARAARPDAKLFLNENVVEYLPAKRAALVELVRSLVDDGVPIDGVGLQVHLFGGAPDDGVIAELVESFGAMGLEVALTELDVPVRGAVDEQRQLDTYVQVVDECLAAGCRDITLWGFTDRYSWLDIFLEPGLTPLIFDEDYQPKRVHAALRQVLEEALAPNG